MNPAAGGQNTPQDASGHGLVSGGRDAAQDVSAARGAEYLWLAPAVVYHGTDGVQYGLDGPQFDPRSLTAREREIARALLRYIENRFLEAEMNPLTQRMAPP